MILVLGQGLLGKTLSKLYPEVVNLGSKDCDIRRPEQIFAVLKAYNPTYVINCAGVVPKSDRYKNPLEIFQVNSLGPKLLEEACSEVESKLIHISTDCVFSGKSGNYDEHDIPDPDSLYGMSKYLGEIVDYPHITLRTSFVGYPDFGRRGLLDWFKSAETVYGYTNSLWNGLTVTELSHFIMNHLDLVEGLYHVHARDTISKHDLLSLVNEIYGWNKEIIPQDTPAINRTLKSWYLASVDKDYRTMLEEMKAQLGDLDEGLS